MVVAALVAGCDGNNTTKTSSCSVGEVRCACYPNSSCNDGLVCRSQVCVVADDGAGGNGAASSGGATSTASTSSGVGGNSVEQAGGYSNIGSGGVAPMGATGGNSNGGVTSQATGGFATIGNGGAVVLGTGGVMATGGTVSTTVSTGGKSATGGQIGTGGVPVVSGPNLIKDGTFQSFDTYWNAILQDGESGTYTRPPTASAVCVTNTSTSSSLYYELSFTIGYPNVATDTFVIEAGATYTLTYTVSATYPISLEVKIGHSVSPWTQVFAVATDLPSTSYTTFSHQFTSSAGDTSAGLAFNAVVDLNGRMCFQQVSLTKN
jgi:hypothetical protein